MLGIFEAPAHHLFVPEAHEERDKVGEAFVKGIDVRIRRQQEVGAQAVEQCVRRLVRHVSCARHVKTKAPFCVRPAEALVDFTKPKTSDASSAT